MGANVAEKYGPLPIDGPWGSKYEPPLSVGPQPSPGFVPDPISVKTTDYKPAGFPPPPPVPDPAGDGGGDDIFGYLANLQAQNQSYMDRLFSEQTRRQGLINQAMDVYGRSDAEVKALQDADIASLRGVINDENIRERADEYKNAFLTQARPSLENEITRNRRLTRQSLAQAGVGLSSIRDSNERRNTTQAIGAHNALNAQAFRLGADRETQAQQMSTNVYNSLISTYDRERGRLANSRQFALQRAGLGSQFDLGAAQVGIGSQFNEAKLAQLSDQFGQTMTFKGEELDIRKLLGIFGIEAGMFNNMFAANLDYGDKNNPLVQPYYPFSVGG